MADKKEIEANNRLIAEFMGAKEANLPFGENYIQMEVNTFPNLMWTCKISELEYDTSWDWLMPVVEKISTIKYGWDNCTPFEDNAYPRTFGMLTCDGKPIVRINAQPEFIFDTLIEATWKAVVYFIKGHNTQSKSNQ